MHLHWQSIDKRSKYTPLPNAVVDLHLSQLCMLQRTTTCHTVEMYLQEVFVGRQRTS